MTNFLVAISVMPTILAASVAAPFTPQERKEQTSGLEVQVELEREESKDPRKRHSLKITLRNAGRTPLVISRADLPWEDRMFSIFLMPVGADVTQRDPSDMYTAVMRRGYIDDPNKERLVMKSGEVLTGRVDLGFEFLLDEALGTRDVILFWSYKMKPLSGPPSRRFGGWLLLPKTEPIKE